MAFSSWPKRQKTWREGRTLYISIPFTWNLPQVRQHIKQGSLLWDQVIVGGPAVKLMPQYLSGLRNVNIQDHMPGVLQRINSWATRTTLGCIRNCSFCAVRQLEGNFQELEDWQDLPIVCDNNLLAASMQHFDRVMDRLDQWGWADFNQGLDARLLNSHHAGRLSRIRPMVRLALDHPQEREQWAQAFETLRRTGMPKKQIRTYVLVGHRDDPGTAWDQCYFVEGHGVKPLPQWFHSLDALEKNKVSHEQRENGWNDYERRRIMQWFYKHKEAVCYS